MKKFIKSRSTSPTDQSYLTSVTADNELPSSSALGTPERLPRPDIGRSTRVTADVKPPLPVDSHPQDYHLSTDINHTAIKQETREVQDRDSEQTDEPMQIEVCKNFIRSGYCPHQGRCNFAPVNIKVMQPPTPPPPEDPAAPNFFNPLPSTSSATHDFNMPSTSGVTRGTSGGVKRTSQDIARAARCDNAYGEPSAKKCKYCDDTKMRLENNLNKVKKMKQSKELLNRKMAILERKNNRLLSIILAVVKSKSYPRVQIYFQGPDTDEMSD